MLLCCFREKKGGEKAGAAADPPYGPSKVPEPRNVAATVAQSGGVGNNGSRKRKAEAAPLASRQERRIIKQRSRDSLKGAAAVGDQVRRSKKLHKAKIHCHTCTCTCCIPLSRSPALAPPRSHLLFASRSARWSHRGTSPTTEVGRKMSNWVLLWRRTWPHTPSQVRVSG